MVLPKFSEDERLLQRSDFIEAVEKGAKAAADGDLYLQSDAEKILESFGSIDTKQQITT